MCGVLGFSKLTPKTRNMAAFLAYSMESRGDDSWGGSDGNEVVKRVGPISQGFFIPKGWKSAIFHTRAATVGAVTERNAHPFVVDREGKAPIIGIHNGSVWNWQSMNDKYKRTCEVDSEHIFYQIAHGLPLHELNGRGTIAWFDEFKGQRLINLARWSLGDLEVADLGEDGIAFCSTKEPLERAARMCRAQKCELYAPLKDCQRYIMEPASLVDTQEKMEFNKTFSGWGGGRNSHWGFSGVGSGNYTYQCKKCSKVWSSKVICGSCLRDMRTAFELMKKAGGRVIMLPAATTV